MIQMKQLKIYNNTTVYVVSPPNHATGGTELLHQLVFKLIANGINAKILYVGDFNGNPIPSSFEHYNISWVRDLEDCKENVLITPESATDQIFYYRKIQKAIWWLSVDNYYKDLPKSKIISSKPVKLLIKRWLGCDKKSLPAIFFRFGSAPKCITHFYQCEYAKHHLVSNGVTDNLLYLSDYLNKVFLEEKVNYTSSEREDIVLYNPLKGIEFTKNLISKGSDIKWVPLEKMTPPQVQSLLKKSKVYIDFGNHPGKDRFPREAAISGCCVITGMRGSAAFQQDVPIPSKYKFDDNQADLELIIQGIRECLVNYDSLINDF